MSIGANVKKAVLTKTVDGIVSYLQVDPERRIARAVDRAYTISNTLNFLPVYKNQLKSLKDSFDNDSAWKHLFINVFKDTDAKSAQKLARNFVVNSGWYGGAKAYSITK
ncbi:MAG: radical SAM protein, partial [Caldisericaceae bacterium]